MAIYTRRSPLMVKADLSPPDRRVAGAAVRGRIMIQGYLTPMAALAVWKGSLIMRNLPPAVRVVTVQTIPMVMSLGYGMAVCAFFVALVIKGDEVPVPSVMALVALTFIMASRQIDCVTGFAISETLMVNGLLPNFRVNVAITASTAVMLPW